MRISLINGMAAAFLLASATSTSRAAVRYVNVAAPTGGDGTSWAEAIDDLGQALGGAAAGDSVWVASGVYTPDGDSGSRFATFTVPSGVDVLGGFVGDETDPDQRDLAANPTVLSGDLAGDDGPDFAGNGENSHHVVTVDGDSTLDGLTISGGNATEPGSGGAGLVASGDVTLRSCTLESNMTDLSGTGGGALYASGGAVTIDGCTISSNLVPHQHGGGAYIVNASAVTITDSTIIGNESDVGAGVSMNGVGVLTISGTSFYGNYSEAGGGGVFAFDVDTTSVSGCTFQNNDGGFTGGGMQLGGNVATFWSCAFTENVSSDHPGGLGSSADTLVVNCVFSRNAAQTGGGAIFSEAAVIVNSTFSGNDGGAIKSDGGSGQITIRNSILWGNGQSPFNGPVVPDVAFSDVQGGWPGSNNIDADPLFVQAGTDDVRLSFGSPALDAGDNGAVPAGVTTDIQGNARIANGTVDLGAYEGAHDPMPPAAMVSDIDSGETVMIIFGDGTLDPLSNTMLVVRNDTASDDAYMAAVDEQANQYPQAEGFSALETTLTMNTDLPTGQFHACVIRPFAAADLAGADPLSLDLTSFASDTANWALAVSANTAPSPGHDGPIGDRSTVIAPAPYGVTDEIGDYGVHWDPQTQTGFVWANIDHVAATSLGVPLCPADAQQPPDGFIGMTDLFQIIDAWGDGPGPADVDNDGTVDFGDMLLVISNWGSCG